MRTVTFYSVLAGAADLAGLDVTDLVQAQLDSLVRKINRRVRKAAGYDRWPELVPTERRLYRDEYAAATAYAAPTLTTASEVFYTAAGKYYQALRAATGQVPSTLVGSDYVVNSAYWAESAAGYTGNDWAALTVYAAGAVVRNPVDGRYYACFTAHTSIAGTIDTTKFGVLTPFAPYIGLDQAGQTPIGEVVAIYASDPDVNVSNPGKLRHTVRARGVVPLDSAPAIVWVRFRIRVPVFTATPWSGATAYVAGNLVFVAATEECYRALQAGTNQAPASSPSYWVKVDFPQVLADFTMRAAAADVMRADGQTEKADREQAQAFNELDDGRTIEIEGQGISDSVAAETY